MKNHIIAIMLSAVASMASAEMVVDHVGVEGLRVERSGSSLKVDMNLILDSLNVTSGKSVVLTPVVVNGTDSVSLPPVAVYGRSRYYYYQRQGGDKALDPAAISFMAKERPASLAYSRETPYRDWMDGAQIALLSVERGCEACETGRSYSVIGSYRPEFFPRLVYVQPAAVAEKRRSLEGRSYIDFPVNRTEIDPSYRRNPAELDSIRRTIDLVRNDRFARIDTIWLKGYASPEGSFSHNGELAMGRTEALKEYINRLYRFENVELLTAFEAEDWAGLRRLVEGSNIDHREEIIALIDSDMEPDVKEARIKKLYPASYRFMLNEFYPSLRHTDYRVSYVITSFTDPETILSVMQVKPQNLSEEEFFVAAASLEPGSDEFTEVFETAVRIFPGNETANLNAANAALRRDDFKAAERYLAKAGTSAEADYARAALEIRRGNLDAARPMLEAASTKGLEQASLTLNELNIRN